MRYLILALSLLLIFPAMGLAQMPDGNDILRQIDENQSAENMIATSTMVIHGRRASRSVTAKSWIQGTEKSFTEYLSPPREAGTKMLKLEDELWMYSPQTDRTIRIAGHMLRQSVMGSDLSYEDMMEDPKLENMYTAEVVGEEMFNDRDCWVLELTATKEDIAYHSRKIWVDKERMLPLKENRYAKSGKLLKTAEIHEVMREDSRWYPKRMTFKDALSQGEGTEYIIESIEFNADIPEYIFTKASLRR
ncbi:MAG: outer membrane lipoprotein-sorting protein [Candidatus Marinimicrobia bacterium]|nr:outer membrane lipoprotein-sorting protein [Candidatus Neomarinimicrobiota bacterium]MCF7829599.1 outer membrane lipoprotein-sorting protein [Candidatus Neomarinimicrobiota bacterium]MCF7882253.1 outer membrane lipoprotein-sorting protein [Candidatus Neomarinimicrobiota bacterium]